MGTLRLLFILPILTITSCMDQLKLVYEWKQLDFQYQSPENRQRALDSKTFIPENNIPAGLEIYEDRLFVTVPRWKSGVPSSLNYIDLKNASTNSPKLIPYPSWAAHTILENSPPEIVSPFRVRADRCGHLWVLDSGKIGVLEPNVTTYPPALIIYDLKTDKLLRKYIFPAEQVDEDSSFANIAVEVIDCNNIFAYASDSGKAGIVVYSWEKNESWRVTHNYMHLDPMMTNFNVNGIDFSWSLAIYGIGLSAPDSEGYATLYFHPMSSTNEFAVSTKYLRDRSLVGKEFKAFKVLGSRGTNAQSSVSFLDPQTGVLFYSLVSLNAVACWRTKNKSYTMENQGRIYMNNETMVYPTDIKVDYNRNLWILSNKLPLWMHDKMDFNEVNYRIFSNPILEAISHTACDVVARTDILDVAQNKKLPMPEIEPASEPAPEPTAKKTSSAGTFAPTVLGIALAISCTFNSVYNN